MRKRHLRPSKGPAKYSNSNGVATLDTAFSDPPTFAEMETMRAKINELILALRR